MVVWITSEKHKSGEKWDLDVYKSTNNIFFRRWLTIILDMTLLEKENGHVQ